jgi:hypothetical protein
MDEYRVGEVGGLAGGHRFFVDGGRGPDAPSSKRKKFSEISHKLQRISYAKRKYDEKNRKIAAARRARGFLPKLNERQEKTKKQLELQKARAIKHMEKLDSLKTAWKMANAGNKATYGTAKNPYFGRKRVPPLYGFGSPKTRSLHQGGRKLPPKCSGPNCEK